MKLKSAHWQKTTIKKHIKILFKNTDTSALRLELALTLFTEIKLSRFQKLN